MARKWLEALHVRDGKGKFAAKAGDTVVEPSKSPGRYHVGVVKDDGSVGYHAKSVSGKKNAIEAANKLPGRTVEVTPKGSDNVVHSMGGQTAKPKPTGKLDQNLHDWKMEKYAKEAQAKPKVQDHKSMTPADKEAAYFEMHGVHSKEWYQQQAAGNGEVVTSLDQVDVGETLTHPAFGDVKVVKKYPDKNGVDVIVPGDPQAKFLPLGKLRKKSVQARSMHSDRIDGVEIARVGEWQGLTGKFRVTEKDLEEAVRASSDPAFLAPRLKLGHTDPRFDGEPAFGRIAGLRLEDDGKALVADYVGLPSWLSKGIGTHFPSRSLEGRFNATSPETGEKFGFVIDAVALLGAQLPAITTIKDLELIAEDGMAVAARQVHAFFSGAPRSESPGLTDPNNQEDTMDPKLIRETLGLAEDATDENVIATIENLRETAGDTQIEVPEGMSLVDNSTLEGLKVAASAGQEARNVQLAAERERVVDEAIMAGKFPPAQKDHYVGLMEVAPEKTQAIIEVMASGQVPVSELGGTADVNHGGEREQAEYASVLSSFGITTPKEG